MNLKDHMDIPQILKSIGREDVDPDMVWIRLARNTDSPGYNSALVYKRHGCIGPAEHLTWIKKPA